MTTGKTIALTRQTFVGKVMSLLFNMLSRLVQALLPRGKRLLIQEISPEYLLEGLMLKLQLWPPDAKDRLIGKDPDARKD